MSIPRFDAHSLSIHIHVLYGLVPIALYKFDPKDMIYATFEEQMSEDVFAQKKRNTDIEVAYYFGPSVCKFIKYGALQTHLNCNFMCLYLFYPLPPFTNGWRLFISDNQTLHIYEFNHKTMKKSSMSFS